DLLDLSVGLRRAAHDGRGGDGAAEDGEVAGGAVADGGDLVVVDAGDAVHRLGHVIDLRQDFFIEDVPILDLEHDVDVIGPAELLGELKVNLHEGVAV